VKSARVKPGLSLSELPIPIRVRDVLDGHVLAEGDDLHLGPWDVRVLVEL
jgi:hypothetical protein